MDQNVSKLIMTLLEGGFGALLILVFILLAFKKQVGEMISRASKIAIHLGPNISFELDGATAQKTFKELFTEMDTVIRTLLTPSERALFLKVLDAKGGSKVGDIMNGFAREPEKLKQLRALRGVSLIRPAEGGNWQVDKTIQVTTLGRIVGEHMRGALEQPAK